VFRLSITSYFFCSVITTDDLIDKASQVSFCFSLGYFYDTLFCQGFTCKVDVAYTITTVFIVEFGNMPWRYRNENFCLGDQLFLGIHPCIQRDKIDQTDACKCPALFPFRNKTAILRRWDYPTLALPQFDFVFFKTRRTDSCDILSI